VDTEFHLRLPASHHESAVHLFRPDLRGVPRLRKAFSLLTPDNVAKPDGLGQEAADASSPLYRIGRIGAEGTTVTPRRHIGSVMGDKERA
jgi:hypothetical protein